MKPSYSLNLIDIGQNTDDAPLFISITTKALPVAVYSNSKQKQYKGLSVEASCRKYLDAIAQHIALSYEFDIRYSNPTMGDIFRVKDGKQGDAWDFRTKKGKTLTDITLPSLFPLKVE